ncbi:Dihydrolipoyllysine-residue succinyltransferase component of 2-oxoglutarate dehydrogenase complex [Waddlia chondrophila 2032/99]|uniref:Dihydrolipoyllysine-residue succinyltransferase n=1 Tax=Waddlia chondrophila 2032/99 TaxID=765953 RepID=F8LDG5_9BACT|nr:Dihydrolipoyllysine-residue succinyltransferase component of 2-oxoglutarate dehydrogenase complex [Waddlia chondrophila 2032/99]
MEKRKHEIMKEEIKVPAMGESITEATVGQILKPSGSHVKMDEEILELETDKVNQVLYASQTGVLTLTVETDDVVKIDQVIGLIDSDGGKPEKKEEKASAPVLKKEEKKSEKGIRHSREAFVAEIGKQEKSAPPPTMKKERGETRRRMTKIRKVIAKRLVEAQAATAMLTTFNEADLSQVMKLRTKYKEAFIKEHDAKLGFMSFFVKAVVSALETFPDINSYIDGDEIVHRDYYDIGIAVGTERGLIVPVLRDCDQKNFADIEKGIIEFAEKARAGTISVNDLQGGGFTITNGGIYGSMLSTPILNHPQVGILGMHNIQKRAVVVNDEIVIRPMMYLALSYDHRIVDGKEAVSFLVHVKNCLEDPSRLLLGV